jgi:signal transduction histidine kinase
MATTDRPRGGAVVSRPRTVRVWPLSPWPRSNAGSRQLASPGQIAVIYRWLAWALALGLIASGSTTTYGRHWQRQGEVYLLVGLTLLVNLLLTFALRPYMRLMRRYPAILVLDVVFCLVVYSRSNIWTSPFQFYSYASLMLPVALFFFWGALVGSLLFLALNLVLLYGAGYSFPWAQGIGSADTYLMQLAIVPLLALVFAYPNRLYARLRLAQQRLDQVEREQLLASERTRIAQSLHDSVAQMLFGMGMLADSALTRLTELSASSRAGGGADGTAPRVGTEPLEERAPLADVLRQVRDLAARGNQEMRRAIYALNEPGPARRGLPASLQAMMADMAARTGVDAHLALLGSEPAVLPSPNTFQSTSRASAATTAGAPDVTPILHGEPGEILASAEGGGDGSGDDADERAATDLQALPAPVALALYRVAREALANVEKHAEAMNVWVELSMHPAAGSPHRQRVALVVRDDGRGFRRPLLAQPGEPDEDELGQIHFGLGNMRRAAEAVGGRLEVTTGPGRGTTVTASVPLP